MDTAKVFMSGRSQAVRLPKEYRFDTDEVILRRTPEGLLLVPKPAKNLGEELTAMFARIDAQFPDEVGDIDDFVRPDQGEFERHGDWFADVVAPAVHEEQRAYGVAPSAKLKTPGATPTRKRTARRRRP